MVRIAYKMIMKPIRSPIEEENFRVPEGWQSLGEIERSEYCRAAKVEDFLKEIKGCDKRSSGQEISGASYYETLLVSRWGKSSKPGYNLSDAGICGSRICGHLSG